MAVTYLSGIVADEDGIIPPDSKLEFKMLSYLYRA